MYTLRSRGCNGSRCDRCSRRCGRHCGAGRVPAWFRSSVRDRLVLRWFVVLSSLRRAVGAWRALMFRWCGVAGFLSRGIPGGLLSGLLIDGLSRFLRRCVVLFRYLCGQCVFVIACQISLTPRPVTAENGSGSACCRIAVNTFCCSVLLNLSILDATTI